MSRLCRQLYPYTCSSASYVGPAPYLAALRVAVTCYKALHRRLTKGCANANAENAGSSASLKVVTAWTAHFALLSMALHRRTSLPSLSKGSSFHVLKTWFMARDMGVPSTQPRNPDWPGFSAVINKCWCARSLMTQGPYATRTRSAVVLLFQQRAGMCGMSARPWSSLMKGVWFHYLWHIKPPKSYPRSRSKAKTEPDLQGRSSFIVAMLV